MRFRFDGDKVHYYIILFFARIANKLSAELKHEARELIRDGVLRVLHKMPPAERDRELIKEAMRVMQNK